MTPSVRQIGCGFEPDKSLSSDKMIMNADLLIRKHQEAEFDAAREPLVAQEVWRPLKDSDTGPWPAYNIGTIRSEIGARRKRPRSLKERVPLDRAARPRRP